MLLHLHPQFIAQGGFEPPLPGPKPDMIDRYTTGLKFSSLFEVLPDNHQKMY
jgi:hypothetical protein